MRVHAVPSQVQVSSRIWLPDWPPNSTVVPVAASKAAAALTRAGGAGPGDSLVQVSRAAELAAAALGTLRRSRAKTAMTDATHEATALSRLLVGLLRTWGVAAPTGRGGGQRYLIPAPADGRVTTFAPRSGPPRTARPPSPGPSPPPRDPRGLRPTRRHGRPTGAVS